MHTIIRVVFNVQRSHCLIIIFLNDCRCGGKFDLVLFISCLILGLCLLKWNLDFINVLGIYYFEN